MEQTQTYNSELRDVGCLGKASADFQWILPGFSRTLLQAALQRSKRSVQIAEGAEFGKWLASLVVLVVSGGLGGGPKCCCCRWMPNLHAIRSNLQATAASSS